MTGGLTAVPPNTVNLVAYAYAPKPCSVSDGSTKSASYPCDCGTAVCSKDQICHGASNYCAAPPKLAPLVKASGDPHLQNIYGQRFGLMQPGRHTLIHVPKGARAHATLLRVSAKAEQIGARCVDMYFQELNVSGKWADVERRGGFFFFHADKGSCSSHSMPRSKAMHLGKLHLKVVYGCTSTSQGVSYLNFYVKHLGHVGFAVGGLLGEDDHSAAATRQKSCQHDSVSI